MIGDLIILRMADGQSTCFHVLKLRVVAIGTSSSSLGTRPQPENHSLDYILPPLMGVKSQMSNKQLIFWHVWPSDRKTALLEHKRLILLEPKQTMEGQRKEPGTPWGPEHAPSVARCCRGPPNPPTDSLFLFLISQLEELLNQAGASIPIFVHRHDIWDERSDHKASNSS